MNPNILAKYFIPHSKCTKTLKDEYRGRFRTDCMVNKLKEACGGGKLGHIIALDVIEATSEDSIAQVATVKTDKSGNIVAWYVITKAFIENNGKRRDKRLPVSDVKEYFDHWVERMIESFRTTTGCTRDFKEIYLCMYAKFKNYLVTYNKDRCEIQIVNLNTGKIGRARFDGSGMFNIDIGMAIAWARLNNKVIPEFPQTFRKVKLSEMKYGDTFFACGMNNKFVFISPDTECKYAYIVKKYISDGIYELITIRDKDGAHLYTT